MGDPAGFAATAVAGSLLLVSFVWAMLYNYSAGLTLYWTVQNLLTIAQTKLTRSKEPATAVAAKPAGSPKKK